MSIKQIKAEYLVNIWMGIKPSQVTLNQINFKSEQLVKIALVMDKINK